MKTYLKQMRYFHKVFNMSFVLKNKLINISFIANTIDSYLKLKITKTNA